LHQGLKSAKLAKVVVGDPQKEETTMGALASIKQKHDVAEKSLTNFQERKRDEPQYIFDLLL
jgi:acyl-CoA reductase-like NAD-dependent aldehyde dehydrogenase